MESLIALWPAAFALIQAHVFIFLVGFGIVGGIFAVVFGGGMFLYNPVFQILFPAMSFGAIVGNIKVGSFFRGIASTWATRKMIQFKRTFRISAVAFVGTAIGASLIAGLDQRWLFPVTVLAIVVAEAAPYIARKITNRTFNLASFAIGIYTGFLGAGIGILLVSLFRLKSPSDANIAHVKIQARFGEFLLGITAVLVHWFHGNLHAELWIPWSIGAFIGGMIGGYLLKYISTWAGKYQKIVLRTSFAIALVVSFMAFVG